jgi:Spherulation-specific family 4
MRLSRWAALAAAPTLLLTGVHTAPRAPAATTYPNPTCLDTTVPLYSPAMWTTAQGTAPEANIGVGNWGSNTQNSGAGGPGKSKNSTDAAMISKARADGTRILGYIATNYGTSDPGYTAADIEIQMTDWHSWYGVTTFFLDQAPTATTFEPYYATLKSWATAHIGSSAKQWLNMGAYPAASSWMNDANTIMDWEDNTAPATPPGWVKNFPPSRFAMIMNAVPGTASAIAAAVSDIEGAHAKNGFVTSDASYQTLPSRVYWTMFANDAAGTGCG